MEGRQPGEQAGRQAGRGRTAGGGEKRAGAGPHCTHMCTRQHTAVVSMSPRRDDGGAAPCERARSRSAANRGSRVAGPVSPSAVVAVAGRSTAACRTVVALPPEGDREARTRK